MKTIEIDDDLYRFILSQTRSIGESASEILRRLLLKEESFQNVSELQSKLASFDLTAEQDFLRKELQRYDDLDDSQEDELENHSIFGTIDIIEEVEIVSDEDDESELVDELDQVANNDSQLQKHKIKKEKPKQEKVKTDVSSKLTIRKQMAVTKEQRDQSVLKLLKNTTIDSSFIEKIDTLDTFKLQYSVMERFLFILAVLYQYDSAQFEKVVNIKGRSRLYFAKSKEALLESGSSCNPKSIHLCPFWVLGNNNTWRKQKIIEQVMTQMKFSTETIEKIISSIV